MCRRYGIGIEVAGGSLDLLPAEGPLVVAANHPYGILDGLMMGRILSERPCGDCKIMADSVLDRAPELRRMLLPIDFSETREAAARNLATLSEALRYLGEGGAIGIFPGGPISTAPTPFGPALDAAWRSFTAKLADVPEAMVIPLFFECANSRLFQVASHLRYTLRLGLLIPEFRARVDTPIRVVVGEPIPRRAISAFGRDARGLIGFLRQRTNALSPRPVSSDRLGYEFEAKYRDPRPMPRDVSLGAAPMPLLGTTVNPCNWPVVQVSSDSRFLSLLSRRNLPHKLPHSATQVDAGANRVLACTGLLCSGT